MVEDLEEDVEDSVEDEEEAEYELDTAREAIDQAEIADALVGIKDILGLNAEDDNLGCHAVTKVRDRQLALDNLLIPALYSS